MKPWLGIVGIGEDGLDGLGRQARALIDEAELFVGGKRHLAMLPEDGRERLTWTTPLSILVDDIVARRGRRVCVLATGDPMHYGIGVTLARHVSADEVTIIPASSAFSLACARLGWDRARVETLTLHGRPLELLNAYIQSGNRLLILSDGTATPAAVAAVLCRRGYRDSRITVFEHMGGTSERRIDGTAADWPKHDIADFNTVAVECVADPGTVLLPRVPGLPDAVFAHDGQITKREVRAATLATLAPVPGQLLWDVGAGSGAVAIEWMRTAPTCYAVAIERDPTRAGRIAENAALLGTPGLDIREGQAPEALKTLDAPDAVFIGGGLTAAGMFDSCWQALKPGGRLVANAVTLEGEHELFAWRETVGGDLTRLAISRADDLGGLTGWRPFRPVTQFAAVKR